MFYSLRSRILLTHLALAALILAGFGYISLRTLEGTYMKERQVRYFTHANILAGVLSDMLPWHEAEVRSVVRDYGNTAGVRTLALDTSGRVVADAFDTLSDQVLSGSVIRSALSGQGAAMKYYIDSVPVMYVAVPVLQKGSVQGVVFISGRLDDIERAVNDYRRSWLLLGIACLVVAVIFSAALAQAVTGPIRALSQGVKDLAKARLSARVKPSWGEMGELARAFNDMAQKIERLDSSRRAFVADASHELKTPLASIKALAEPLIDADHPDMETVREFLKSIVAEVNRISHLSGQLLDLARMEGAPARMDGARFDLRELLTGIVQRLQTAANTADVHIETEFGDVPVIITGYPDSLESAFYNVLDNAIRYAGRGGTVQISVRRMPEGIEVAIDDTGPGIPVCQREQIFERFYRGDPGRSRKTGGSGLGLAIARAALVLHGGTLVAKDSPLGGARFVATLPQN
ncbi:MAG: ATP-binding protein [Bacillota bacterium]